VVVIRSGRLELRLGPREPEGLTIATPRVRVNPVAGAEQRTRETPQRSPFGDEPVYVERSGSGFGFVGHGVSWRSGCDARVPCATPWPAVGSYRGTFQLITLRAMETMRTVLGSCLVASVAAAQTTWLVDDTPGPGVHFTSLPAAVAAAASGDTLLMAPGSYQPFHVAGKALSIFGAGNGVTIIDGAPVVGSGADYVAITSPPAGTTFRLAGLRIRRDRTTSDFHVLALHGTGVANTGTVCLSDIVCEPGAAATFGFQPNGGTGLLVAGLLVHAHRCNFRGGTHDWPGGFAGDVAVEVIGAATFVADACTLQGGSVTFFAGTQAQGGPALAVDGAIGHVARSTLRGGDIHVGCISWSYGGPALSLAGAAHVRVIGTSSHSLRGGDGFSISQLATGGPAISGPALAVMQVNGSVAMSAGNGNQPAAAIVVGVTVANGPPLPATTVTGTLHANGDLNAAQPVAVAVDGPPGQLFVLLLDLQPGYLDIAALADEPLLLTPAAGFVAVGLLDALGHFGWSFVPVTQAPLLVGVPTHWQAFVWEPATGRWLGSNAEQRRWRP